MEKTRIFGIIFILIGLFGILFVLNSRWVGYAVVSVSESEINESGKLYFSNSDGKIRLEVLDVQEVLSTPGSSKKLSVSIKNMGKEFLDNCSLNFNGNIKDWIYFNDFSEVPIGFGEMVNFVFNLNVPDGTSFGNYSGKMILKCEQGEIEMQDLGVRVFEGFKLIKVKQINYDKRKLDIEYIFDNSRLIGDKTSVDIIIFDKNNMEIYRHKDAFSINTKKVIDRKISLNASHDLFGVYYIHFSPALEPDSYVRESIIIGENSATGFVTLNTGGQRKIGYGVFVAILLLGVLFIVWRGFFGDEEQKKKNSNMDETEENIE